LYHAVDVGSDSVIHSQAVIGADGFGYTPDAKGQMVEIAQIGGVTIGRNVSIGAATTIDRGAIENTIIEDGVKIDNQVQIGHNCIIGEHTLICGCCGIVGSSKIGKHCVFAGDVGVGGDAPIEVCDFVIVSARTLISRSITEPGTYSGSNLYDHNRQWKRNALRFLELDTLFKRVKKLEK
jgi:UDP-3-O-[3-hydroxymyristoyl] glucosamine N-acyltransferase